MSHILRGSRFTGQDSPATSANHRTTRDRLALRSKGFDKEYPEALDLEGKALDAIHPELAGVVGILSGLMDPVHFREILRGDRCPGLTLRDICRLRLSERKEAQRATNALLAVLLAAGPGGADSLSPEGLASFVESTSQVIAGLARDLADGSVSAEEATERLPQVRQLKARVAMVETALEVAIQKDGR